MPDISELDLKIQTTTDEIAAAVETKVQTAKAEGKAEAEAAAAAAIAAKDAEVETLKREGVLAALATIKGRLGI